MGWKYRAPGFEVPDFIQLDEGRLENGAGSSRWDSGRARGRTGVGDCWGTLFSVVGVALDRRDLSRHGIEEAALIPFMSEIKHVREPSCDTVNQPSLGQRRCLWIISSPLLREEFWLLTQAR